MPGETGGGAQLPPAGLLFACNRQRPLQCRLRLNPPTEDREHFSPQTIKFSFKKPLICQFCCLNCLVQQIEAHLGPAEARVGSGDMAEIERAAIASAVAL